LRFAAALARACSRALGETVAGVILDDSVTLDDYLPGRSDIDLLVVVQDPLTDARLAALTVALAGHRPRAPGLVDLRVVTRQVAASPTPAPPLEAYLRLTPPPGYAWRSAGSPGSATWLGELGALDWSRASVDTMSVRAKRGGPGGRKSVDRGKPESKLHLVCDGSGLPLAAAVTAANVADVTMLAAVTSHRCARRQGVGVADPGRSTRTRDMTATTTVPGCGGVGSPCGSHGVGWSPQPGWGATVGGWSGCCRG
jgi:hypothetical protein